MKLKTGQVITDQQLRDLTEQVRDRVKAQPGFKCFLAELPDDEFIAHFKI